jgi:dienelactone hydrolase
MKKVVFLMLSLWMVSSVEAAIAVREIVYKIDTTSFRGYFAYDDSFKGKRPGVLVAHEWWGLNDFARKQAENLAHLGYAAFAVDMYGNGISTNDYATAARMAGEVRGTARMRQRITAGYKAMLSQQIVDAKRTAAIGFCFGGTAVLDLAFGGADCRGVVTFHGGLFPPKPDEFGNIKAKFLILHGANDPTMTPEVVSQFQESMRNSNADWRMVYFGNTVHSFTNPSAGSDPKNGIAYNALSAARAFSCMKLFLEEIM